MEPYSTYSFVWLLSFNIMILRITHAGVFNSSVFFIAEEYSIVCIQQILVIHSPVDRYVAFQFLSIQRNYYKHLCISLCIDICILFSYINAYKKDWIIW